MTPAACRRFWCQVCGCDRLMMRNVSGRTKTIRSRIGSRGMVITSMMTRSSSTSAMPPRDPAGARSTDSVSSTRSPIANSSIVAIPSSVELGVSGYQPRCCLFIRVVPRCENWSGSSVDDYVDKDTVTDGDPGAMDFRNWRHRDGLSNAVPYLICILDLYVKNTFPFRSVPIRSKYPLQLDSLVPNTRSSGKGLSNSRRPGHGGDARKQRRVGVRLRSILCTGNHTEVGRAL